MPEDVKAHVEAAMSFGRAHLEDLCADSLAWKQGCGIGEKLSELARLCARYIGGPNSLDAADAIVSHLAKERIAGQARGARGG